MSFANGTTFTFVAGVEEAVRLARDAAGDGNVRVSGGASVASQAVAAGLVDAFEIHVAPILLGAGARLFDGVGFTRLDGRVAHLTYRASAQ